MEDERQHNIPSQHQNKLHIQMVNEQLEYQMHQQPSETTQPSNNPSFPPQYKFYQKQCLILYRTKAIFKALLCQWKICIRCIFRIYNVSLPSMYTNQSIQLFLMGQLCISEPISNIKTDQFLQEYDKKNLRIKDKIRETCWMCEGLLQNPYINDLASDILKQIKNKAFINSKFKLNIRVPPFLTLKQHFFCRYLYFQASENKVPADQLYTIYNVFIVPLNNKTALQIKMVFKLVIAYFLRKISQMDSTIEELEDNLTIAIELTYNNPDLQSILANQFDTLLPLQKIPKNHQKSQSHKKVKIDLTELKTQNVKCNAANINRILQLFSKEFHSFFQSAGQLQHIQRMLGSSNPIMGNCFCHKVQLHTKSVYLCGKYLKFSRQLSQTPWMLNGKQLTSGSLQEHIENQIYPLFYPGLQRKDVQILFHSGGREDIDVRMLQGGRPFVIQFVNPLRRFTSLSLDDILNFCHPELSKDVLGKTIEETKVQAKRKKLGIQGNLQDKISLLEEKINNSNQFVHVRELKPTDQSYISKELKEAESEKIKHYVSFIISPEGFTEADADTMSLLVNAKITQKTPLRVLHRRTLMERDKIIHRTKLHLVTSNSAILEIWASAGTYIKEFVHGDMGRTTPNVGSLLGKEEIDILQLDVGGLKQGKWEEGDQKLLKLPPFVWEQ